MTLSLQALEFTSARQFFEQNDISDLQAEIQKSSRKQ